MAQPITQLTIDTLFDIGAHFARSRSRRHPSAEKYIFGNKDANDIFDLMQTSACLEKALTEVTKAAREGKQILFIGGKPEVAATVKAAAERVGAPYVAGRWVGGTLTNFKQIRKRINRLEMLIQEKERGDLEKYTKHERLLIDREIEKLDHRFHGLVDMREIPAILFVVDTHFEHIAVSEAMHMNVPVIGLSNSDCDFADSTYPIPANTSSIKSVSYFVHAVADAYWAYKKTVAPTGKSRNKKV